MGAKRKQEGQQGESHVNIMGSKIAAVGGACNHYKFQTAAPFKGRIAL